MKNNYRVKALISTFCQAEIKRWWFPIWLPIGGVHLGLKHALSFLSEKANGTYKKPKSPGKVIWTGTKENLPAPISIK